MEDTNIYELVLKTTGAGALGIAGAEAFRAAFHTFLKSRHLSGSRYHVEIHDFVHSAISAFILIVCSYEKAVLLWTGMRATFFFLTFILCIVFSRIFSSTAPSPCFPLEKHWRVIRQAGVSKKDERDQSNLISGSAIYHMLLVYSRLAMPFILGQILGLFIATSWMKIYWNGWVTSNHVNHLPVLDECISSLNTTTGFAFLIETLLTLALLVSFQRVDNMSLPHEGANELMKTFLARNCLKSAIVIFFMYLFLDVTGSFANPFHALAMQRHCMTNVRSTISILFVYALGPFLATGVFLSYQQSNHIKEAKRSV